MCSTELIAPPSMLITEMDRCASYTQLEKFGLVLTHFYPVETAILTVFDNKYL
jgi:hypothetical protein